LKDRTVDNVRVPEALPFLEAICYDVRDPYVFTRVQMLKKYNERMYLNGVVGTLAGDELNFYNALKNAALMELALAA
jgi:hypothetical protein